MHAAIITAPNAVEILFQFDLIRVWLNKGKESYLYLLEQPKKGDKNGQNYHILLILSEKHTERLCI